MANDSSDPSSPLRETGNEAAEARGVCLIPVDPLRASTSQMGALMRRIGRKTGQEFGDYSKFHAWSCREYQQFWRSFLDTLELPISGDAEPTCTGSGVQDTIFYPQLRLNVVQCLLRPNERFADSAEAVVLRTEADERKSLSRAELRDGSMSVATVLQTSGVEPGDRIIGVARNSLDLVQACLGSTAIGATWSAVGADLGPQAMSSRFIPLEPVVAFVDTEYRAHGQTHSIVDGLNELIASLPNLRLIIGLNGADLDALRVPPGCHLLPFDQLQQARSLKLEDLPHFPFNHPLYILFTSGTTGAPKCLIHGAGGSLLEHMKEHRLHADFGPEDRLLFMTNCGWMMWHWSLSALASGVCLVIFDGSPTFPNAETMPRTLANEHVTVFGTSPAYLQALQNLQLDITEQFDLHTLRTVQSTGSVLHEHQFDWLSEQFGPISIESISGGTDIIGCFVLGNPCMPLIRGDSNSLSLAMDIRAQTSTGRAPHGRGDLICLTPFPSRPIGILNDPDNQRLYASYYEANLGAWTHGDRIRIRAEGSARILGRSDGVLNIRGVRIGPAEVQAIAVAIDGIQEAMALEQLAPAEPGGARLVLLVVMKPGVSLDRPLTLKIKRTLKQRASSVHVPSVIAEVSELPVTHSGKLSESTARAALNGRPIGNPETLRNPQALAAIKLLAVPAETSSTTAANVANGTANGGANP